VKGKKSEKTRKTKHGDKLREMENFPYCLMQDKTNGKEKKFWGGKSGRKINVLFTRLRRNLPPEGIIAENTSQSAHLRKLKKKQGRQALLLDLMDSTRKTTVKKVGKGQEGRGRSGGEGRRRGTVQLSGWEN